MLTNVVLIVLMKKKSITKKCPLESTEAKFFIKLCEMNPILNKYIVMLRNDGTVRNKIEAAENKRKGLRKGVSDYLLPYPIGRYHGLWIELKRVNKSISKPTIDQLKWLSAMKSLNFEAKVAYGGYEAYKICIDYLKNS